MEEGYFILSRSIMDSAVWREDADTLKLWIYLIGQARHSKKPKRYPNFTVNRGDILTSYGKISEDNEFICRGRLKLWSRQQVQRMLESLENGGYITKLSDTYGTLITICNYDSYQTQDNYKRTDG